MQIDALPILLSTEKILGFTNQSWSGTTPPEVHRNKELTSGVANQISYKIDQLRKTNEQNITSSYHFYCFSSKISFLRYRLTFFSCGTCMLQMEKLQELPQSICFQQMVNLRPANPTKSHRFFHPQRSLHRN
jgi:hypothetical protein